MFGVDELIGQLGGGTAAMGVALALLLGLRHATDPDHLTAVATLIVSDRERREQRAAMLGLSWGLGHAVTLTLFGLPVVLFGRMLPPVVLQVAEFLVGMLIAGLAVRLLVRWRRGYFHAHPHDHHGMWHTHPHMHEHRPHAAHPVVHQHRHEDALGRSPMTAFGIGLVHGVGGSAGAGVLLVAASADRVYAVAGLVLFAGATALSMALVSAVASRGLVSRVVAPRLERLVPAFGSLSLAFGLWYAVAALV